MRDLIILGIDNIHAGEIAEIVERINASHPSPVWNLLGYVTPHGNRTGEIFNGYPVLGGPDVLNTSSNACVVPEFGWPRNVPIAHERFISLIDPSVFVSRTAQIGVGCVVYPNSYIGLRAVLGDFVFCLSGSVINHDDVLGNWVTVTSGVCIAGNVTIEDDCYLGQACTIRQQLRIGQHSKIGMGAVVVKNVDPDSVMVGNPARLLK